MPGIFLFLGIPTSGGIPCLGTVYTEIISYGTVEGYLSGYGVCNRETVMTVMINYVVCSGWRVFEGSG